MTTHINSYADEGAVMRARMVYRWPTAPSPIWDKVATGEIPSPDDERCVNNHRERVAFSSRHHKQLVIRHYVRMRQLGAPRSAARWAVMMAVQRALTQQTWTATLDPDGTEIPAGMPVAWFIPTCVVCQQYGEPFDVWESHDVEDYDACPHQDRICGYCGESGHDHDDCPYEPIEED